MRQAKRVAVGSLALCLAFASNAWGEEKPYDDPVRVCTLNWAPFVAEDLPRDGFLNALTRAAFNKVGLSMDMEFMPWARAKLEVKQGDRDMVQAAYYNEKRDKNYIFTDPLYPTEVGLIALQDLGVRSFDSLRELADYEIGLARGFTTSPEFDSADYLNKEPVKNNRLNVRKLYDGRIDMIAMNFDRFMYLARDEGFDPDRAVFLEPKLAEHQLYLMASKATSDGKAIVEQFNKGLEQIKADGTYDRILKEMGMAR